MKNQYFGDVGDYGKYAMLRFLAKNGVSIAINWYLTLDDNSNDGKFISYLDDEKMKNYDPQLFDVLKTMISENKRSVIQFEAKNLTQSEIGKIQMD